MQIPTFKTDRLILRAPAADDADGYVAFVRSNRSALSGGPIETREEAQFLFSATAGLWILRGYSKFVWALKSNNRAIGWGGAWFPFAYEEPELAWSIWSGENEGKGFAREAITALLPFVRSLGLSSLVSLIHPENERSRALASHLGAVAEVGRQKDAGHDLTYRHPKESFACPTP